MSAYEELLFSTIPGLLGTMLVAYAVFLIHRRRREFFSAVRGWVVTIFMACVAVLWAMELLDAYIGSAYHDHHDEVDITFIAVTAWLSFCGVALSTTYRPYASFQHFAKWLRKEPLNLITVWGAVAAALIVFSWVSDPDPESTSGRWWFMVGVATVYLAGTIALDAALPIRARKRGEIGATFGRGTQIMVLLVVAWVGIPLVELLFDVLLNLTYGYEEYNPYSWLMVGLFAFIVGSIARKDFEVIIVDPEVESTTRAGFRAFDIPRGVYLYEDEKPEQAMKLFAELVSTPLRPDIDLSGREHSAADTLHFLIPRGLMVTREFPENIRLVHGLEVTPIIWLTESPGERRIAPTSIAVLTDTMTRFMESNPNSIVMLEGVEYITTFNDFKRVLRALDSLNETTWVTRARLIISVNPQAFDPKDLAMLERDRNVLRGRAAIEELKRESRMEGLSTPPGT